MTSAGSEVVLGMPYAWVRIRYSWRYEDQLVGFMQLIRKLKSYRDGQDSCIYGDSFRGMIRCVACVQCMQMLFFSLLC